jgi:hypothetical protein
LRHTGTTLLDPEQTRRLQRAKRTDAGKMSSASSLRPSGQRRSVATFRTVRILPRLRVLGAAQQLPEDLTTDDSWRPRRTTGCHSFRMSFCAVEITEPVVLGRLIGSQERVNDNDVTFACIELLEDGSRIAGGVE